MIKEKEKRKKSSTYTMYKVKYIKIFMCMHHKWKCTCKDENKSIMGDFSSLPKFQLIFFIRSLSIELFS
jgi:hypothetical protein